MSSSMNPKVLWSCRINQSNIMYRASSPHYICMYLFLTGLNCPHQNLTIFRAHPIQLLDWSFQIFEPSGSVEFVASATRIIIIIYILFNPIEITTFNNLTYFTILNKHAGSWILSITWKITLRYRDDGEAVLDTMISAWAHSCQVSAHYYSSKIILNTIEKLHIYHKKGAASLH